MKQESDEGELLQLVIREARLKDSGSFSCTAVNDHGSSAADFHLLVQGIFQLDQKTYDYNK